MRHRGHRVAMAPVLFPDAARDSPRNEPPTTTTGNPGRSWIRAQVGRPRATISTMAGDPFPFVPPAAASSAQRRRGRGLDRNRDEVRVANGSCPAPADRPCPDAFHLRLDEPAVLPEPTPPNPVHRPVLLTRSSTGWRPRARARCVVDGTVGAGGHAAALAERAGRGRAADRARPRPRDAGPGRAGDARGCRSPWSRASYSDLGEVLDDLGIDAVDGILLDLGLSSDQLAWAHRGFSFAADGPLDMRFDPEGRPTAAELVNTWSEEELARLFFEYGEERYSRRVARRIVEARRVEPIATTGRLAEIVRKSIPGKWGPIDPATRVFQALRIAVNDELEHLERALDHLADWLKPGGRAAVISFHSLEDRRVKRGVPRRPATDRPDPKTRGGDGPGSGRQPPGAKREIEGRRAMSESGWTTGAAEPPIPGSVEEVRPLNHDHPESDGHDDATSSDGDATSRATADDRDAPAPSRPRVPPRPGSLLRHEARGPDRDRRAPLVPDPGDGPGRQQGEGTSPRRAGRRRWRRSPTRSLEQARRTAAAILANAPSTRTSPGARTRVASETPLPPLAGRACRRPPLVRLRARAAGTPP